MLILAGITIVTVLSDNGILKTAQDAAEKNKMAEARTKVDIVIAEWQLLEDITDKTFESYLKEAFGDANVTVNEVSFDVKVDGYTFVVKDNGTVLTGTKVKLADGSTVTLTEASYGEYLGREVKYIPARPSTSYGTSTKYRIFYIDFAGKYGEEGTVYLKADCDDKGVALNSYTNYTSTDEYAVMKSLNPSWVKAETLQTNDKCVSWILDPNVWENWKDTTTEGIKGNINYVVGAPSLEIFIDSYNKYLDSHPGLIKSDGKNPAQKLACEYVTSGYNAKGYRIGFADVESESWVHTGYWQDLNSLISYEEANGMYNPGAYAEHYWLASTCAIGIDRILYVSGKQNRLANDHYNTSDVFCPLVSLKSNVQLELLD